MMPDAGVVKQHVLDVFTGQLPVAEPLLEAEPEDNAEPVPIAHPLSGTWSGLIESQTSDFKGDLILTIGDVCEVSEICGTFHLPKSGCMGNLVMESAVGKEFVFLEELTGGPEYCLDGGRETLEILEDSTLSYYYENKHEDGLTTTVGTLVKE